MTNNELALCYYSEGQAYAHKTAREYLAKGELKRATAWQLTARMWSAYREELLDVSYIAPQAQRDAKIAHALAKTAGQ